MDIDNIIKELEYAQANPPYECDEDSYAMAIQLALDLLDNLRGPAVVPYTVQVE